MLTHTTHVQQIGCLVRANTLAPHRPTDISTIQYAHANTHAHTYVPTDTHTVTWSCVHVQMEPYLNFSSLKDLGSYPGTISLQRVKDDPSLLTQLLHTLWLPPTVSTATHTTSQALLAALCRAFYAMLWPWSPNRL